MDVVVVPAARIASVGAGLVHAALAEPGRAEPTLMPALGTSALPIYRELGAWRTTGRLDASGLRLVQLDEYEGLSDDDPRLLSSWLRRDVAAPLGVADDRIVRLGGPFAAAEATCRAYDAGVAAAGGIDVAVLGLGPNGHLGFNEPPSDADAPTRSVALTMASLRANARYWPGLGVPTRALTAGMATILAARRIVLVVTGEGKRSILRDLLVGPISAALPASWLRPLATATLLADEDAWPGDVPRSASPVP